MKRLVFLFLTVSCLAAGYSAGAQGVVSGVVFNDANLNSRLDAGEKGVANVGVSNGSAVTQTDRNGRYELPATDNMIVFVIKPSGYRVPVDDMHLSRFYYIHKPGGSPALKYPGSAPTGALPAQVNFPLVKYNEPENFNVLAFGDTQPYSDNDIDYLRRGVANNLSGIGNIAFGTTLGDITGDRPDYFKPVTSIISRIGVPWYHVAGNHDHNYDTDNDRIATESYEAFYGPATYSFNYGKVHFIVFDDIIHSLNDAGRAQYVGGLREDQLQFVENDLKLVPADRLVVLLMHIPFDLGTGTSFRSADRDRLFAAMAKFPNTFSLSAHTHYIKHIFYGKNDGWQREKPHHHLNAGAICGDWWKGVLDQYNLPGTMMRDGSPQGYFVLKFTGNQYIYDYELVHFDDPKQISLHIKDNVLYANFFVGEKSNRLRYRVNGGEWTIMQPSRERDPLFVSIYERWSEKPDAPGRQPSAPVVSEHLWKANISIEAPDSIVEVEATDMFGRTYTQRMVVK